MDAIIAPVLVALIKRPSAFFVHCLINFGDRQMIAQTSDGRRRYDSNNRAENIVIFLDRRRRLARRRIIDAERNDYVNDRQSLPMPIARLRESDKN